MPHYCCINECNSISSNVPGDGVGFFMFPSVRTRGTKLAELANERRNRWFKAINNKTLNTKSARICSKHFISGKCARLKDNQNPDWVPSLNLGYKTVPLVPENILRTQPKGSKNVDVKSVETKENVSANIMAPENYGAYQDTASEELVLDNVFEENASAKRGESQGLDFSHQEDMGQLMLVTENEENGNDDSYVEESSSNTVGTQTDLWMIEIDDSQLKLKEVQFTLDLRDAKIAALQKQLENTKMGIESFRNDDVKTNYFTGLPLFLTLFTLYNAIESNIPSCLLKNLNKFQVLILTLVKLRLNLPFKLLGYIFGISTQTASKKFHECILVLNMEMNAFVRWPDRNARTYFTPYSFKQLFGNRLAVIIDCFEIRIEKSGEPLARAATFSSYKSSETIKYLIGISPSGNINYISNGFGGRTSDKFIAENSDFLSYIGPGDIVLSDRGFLIREAVERKGAELKTPAFMEGKPQLGPDSVEYSKNLSLVRIHVERVIGNLRQKYTILSHFQPMTTISKRINEDEVYYDAIVRTCCGLVNLTPSVIPSTLNE